MANLIKHFTSVNYNPRVVIWAIFKSYDSRVVNYDCKVLYKIDHCRYKVFLPKIPDPRDFLPKVCNLKLAERLLSLKTDTGLTFPPNT